jgi:hypothetical protein
VRSGTAALLAGRANAVAGVATRGALARTRGLVGFHDQALATFALA